MYVYMVSFFGRNASSVVPNTFLSYYINSMFPFLGPQYTIIFGASTNRFRPAASDQMMLIDAGRGQEALELDEELLGYLKEERHRNVDELVENHVYTMEAAIKYVATLSRILGRSWY